MPLALGCLWGVVVAQRPLSPLQCIPHSVGHGYWPPCGKSKPAIERSAGEEKSGIMDGSRRRAPCQRQVMAGLGETGHGRNF
jgi:hypothetical protein